MLKAVLGENMEILFVLAASGWNLLKYTTPNY